MIAKKGDISMNMIIMAVIALLVLAIIAYLIFDSGSNIQDAQSCTALNGLCADTCGEGQAQDYPIQNPAGSCPSDGPSMCCIRLSST